MKSALALLLLSFSLPALASQEQTHRWKQVTVVADAGTFGDVEVTASADAAGHVTALAVHVGKAAFTLPTSWLEPRRLAIASIEVRSEPGYDKQPWLYVVFHEDLAPAKSRRDDAQLHIAIHDGKLAGATETVTDAGGTIHSAQLATP